MFVGIGVVNCKLINPKLKLILVIMVALGMVILLFIMDNQWFPHPNYNYKYYEVTILCGLFILMFFIAASLIQLNFQWSQNDEVQLQTNLGEFDWSNDFNRKKCYNSRMEMPIVLSDCCNV